MTSRSAPAPPIDRGGMRDTVIGEGTKIDNLVQIGHNVVIGRHCIIVAQSGLSGSVTIEDFVMLGGQVGVAPHITVGKGARLAARAGVITDIPAGQDYRRPSCDPAPPMAAPADRAGKAANEKPGKDSRDRSGADAQTRTGTELSPLRILSPLRLPFRHVGPRRF